MMKRKTGTLKRFLFTNYRTESCREAVLINYEINILSD
jgi:hypothetical protein